MVREDVSEFKVTMHGYLKRSACQILSMNKMETEFGFYWFQKVLLIRIVDGHKNHTQWCRIDVTDWFCQFCSAIFQNVWNLEL